MCGFIPVYAKFPFVLVIVVVRMKQIIKILIKGKHDFVCESRKTWKGKPYLSIGSIEYDMTVYYYIHLWRFCWCFYGCPYIL